MFKRCVMVLVVAMTTSVLGLFEAPSAQAAIPSFSLTPTSLQFGTTTVHGTATMTATVKNTGSVVMQVRASFPPGPFAHVGGTCINLEEGVARNLGSGGTCTLQVSYTPTAVARQRSVAVLTAVPGIGAPGTDSEYNSTDGPTKNLVLVGSGVALAASVAPTSISFGNVNVGDTAVRTMTFTNTSDVRQQVMPLFRSAGSFSEHPLPPIIGGTPCSRRSGETLAYAVVPPGGQCTVAARFSPTTAGAQSSTLNLQVSRSADQAGTYGPITNESELTKAVALTGKGVLPPFSVSPGSHSFGNVTVGTFKLFTFTVKNTSTGPLEFWPDSIGGPFSGHGSNGPGSCTTTDFFGYTHPVTIPAGGSCSMSVTYFPQELGKATRTFAIGAYDPEPPPPGPSSGPQGARVATKTVEVSGNAVAPTFTASPTSINFGDVTIGGFGTRTVTLKNTSPVGVQFWPRTVGSESPFYVSAEGGGDPCATSFPLGGSVPVTVAPGDSCTVSVFYSSSALGKATDTVEVNVYRFGDQNGPGGPKLATKSIPVSATGIRPTFELEPLPVSFGNVTVDAQKYRIITVTNTSQVTLAFDAATTAGVDFSASEYGDHEGCAQSISPSPVGTYVAVSPGESCTIAVYFTPSGFGARSGVVAVSAHGPVGMFEPLGPALATESFQVSGRGVAPTIAVKPTSVSFSGVPVNTIAVRTVSVTNTSDIPLQMWGAPAGESSFSISPSSSSNGCAEFSPIGQRPITVFPGQSCLMQVVFVPTSTGYRTATLTVNAYRDGDQNGPAGPIVATATVRVSGAGT